MNTGPRDWDAETYDRVAAPQVSWGIEVLERLAAGGRRDRPRRRRRLRPRAELLLERLPDGRLIGVDGSPSMIEKARSAFGARTRVSYVGHRTWLELERRGAAWTSSSPTPPSTGSPTTTPLRAPPRRPQARRPPASPSAGRAATSPSGARGRSPPSPRAPFAEHFERDVHARGTSPAPRRPRSACETPGSSEVETAGSS